MSGGALALAAIVLFAMRQLGLYQPGYPDAIAVAAVLGGMALGGRRRAAQHSSDEDSPQLFDLILCTLAFAALALGLSWWDGLPFASGLALMLLVVGAIVGTVASYVDRRLWWTSLGFVVAAVVTMALPKYRGAWVALAGLALVSRDQTSVQRAMAQRQLLARASKVLNESLDFETTLAMVARLPVPRHADWCVVDVLEDGELRRLGTAHFDETTARVVEELAPDTPSNSQVGDGVLEILRTGKSVLVPKRRRSVTTVSRQVRLRSLHGPDACSYVGVPLMQGDTAFGVLSLVMAESGRSYGPADLELAIALASRAVVALENARLFREAERARAEAEAASRTKDDFLAMLGHELRNPLAPIMTSLEVMKGQPIDSATERARQVIERQARAMMRLVDDLLDVSRLAYSRIELCPESIELAELVGNALEVASPSIEKRRHRVEVDVAPGLVVEVDEARMVQVIVNLLNNAAKYTEPGGLISIRGAAEGHEVVLRVRDDGMGIAAEMLPRIFEVFVQQPQGLERAQGGLGLGLSIVKSLVELHGGRISAHSDGLGTGSELVVRLPVP
ncbi:sensor histidine kinase [Paraliomyxa miuraensis]|uniref:sensor histidine kinase n=1 Tax=Paraliomyxa miuraensis TaxID=376150 RepID=UPI0022517791|nr:GAF domain-containing sensor histidine kinase [Paraliomyxa miuraensis]MCX4246605.1 GAF domain-containing sensor histidine kinase [Paraliomyxa miuraensis]